MKNKESISIKKAISRGQLMVNLPVMLCFTVFAVVGILSSNKEWIPESYILLFFPASFLSAWIIWSIMITKWRIWAFTHVANVRELEKKAVSAKLIWRRGSILERTEIRTQSDKIALAEIAKRMEEPYEYKDDRKLPLRTDIGYMKSKYIFLLLICVGIAAYGVYMLTTANNNVLSFLGLVFVIMSIHRFVLTLRKVNSNEVQLSIDARGITTPKTGFISWEIINNEDVIEKGKGEGTSNYLVFNVNNDDSYHEILLDDLDTDYESVFHMIHTYRLRYKQHKR